MYKKVEINASQYIQFAIVQDTKRAELLSQENRILPDKMILIAREKNGEMKLSMRGAKYEVLPVLKEAIEGLDGYGGGHLHACGGNFKLASNFGKFSGKRSRLPRKLA